MKYLTVRNLPEDVNRALKADPADPCRSEREHGVLQVVQTGQGNHDLGLYSLIRNRGTTILAVARPIEHSEVVLSGLTNSYQRGLSI